MAVMKVIEILSESSESWEDAVRVGLKKASKSVNNIASVYIKEQTVSIKEGAKVDKFRVNMKVTFKVN